MAIANTETVFNSGAQLMNTSQALSFSADATPRSLARTYLMDAAMFAQKLETEARQIVPRLSDANTPDRKQLEHFIYRAFHNAYGANVTHFMPQLLSLHDRHDHVLAVCGLRQAGSERLFLETYLDQPVEAALSACIGTKVARSDIVEIGNLAVAEFGLTRNLLLEVTSHLRATNTQWAVFTAIPALRNSVIKLNMRLEKLGEAKITSLPEGERAAWGSYYAEKPQVMAICRTR
jgi:hypothetical protein